MNQYHKLTIVLCGIWTLSLIYGEMLAFWVPPLLSCSWPLSNSTADSTDVSIRYTKVAVIADPQLMDRTSFGPNINSLALEFAKFYSDLYIRRAFFSSILPFKPDAVLFLGDYFDGGPYLSDKEWQESLRRFKHIFGIDKVKRDANEIFLIPGNHDVGYSEVGHRFPKVVERYESAFGARNFQFTLGNVEFFSVDAQTLDGKDEPDMYFSSWQFVKNVSTTADHATKTRVLLTHIPLYRPDNHSCGVRRSSQIINQRISFAPGGQGIVYQNYLTEASSLRLLNLLKPALVLSGHDHDQCTIPHESVSGTVPEHTLGTVSWQQGNLYPSFMLLSILNTPNSESLLTQLCFLPMQTHIYFWYIILFLLTVLLLLFWPSKGLKLGVNLGDLMPIIRSYGDAIGSEKKNEDERNEYDILWDAEGSMHLVKKPLTSLLPQNIQASQERGSGAVMRSAAKRSIGADLEESTMGGAEEVKVVPRNDRRSAMRKLKRALPMIGVISALNTPIYMMLLVKDWVDQ